MTTNSNGAPAGGIRQGVDPGWTSWLDAQIESEPQVEVEPLAEGGTHLLDLVSVVDHMRRGVRPGFTVWHALDEALRWWMEDLETSAHGARDPSIDLDLDDPDPLCTALAGLVGTLDHPSDLNAAEALQQAIRRWAATMSRHYNKGCTWPPPLPRRPSPPALPTTAE